ncbi:MAG: 50S ribosomal protein L22 [Clostridia bacterium]|nr:50S ribosomal protein L22 [Clostridia bacterium]
MATRERIKAEKREESRDRRPRASQKYIHLSPSKAKIVVDLVRGKPIDEALAILMYTPKAATRVVTKLINGAAANAENNLAMDRKSLYVAEIYANCGPTQKRGVPRARGRMDLMKRRSCHITVILDEK